VISKKFIKSSLIYTLAGALPMASALILLPFYIAYLPTEVYGALSICLAISILIQVIVTYSFDTSLYIHYHEFKNDPARLRPFISSVFIFMLILGFGVAVFFSIAGGFIFNIAFPNSTISFYPYGLISVGVGIFQAIFKVNGNLLQTRGEPTVFLWSNVVSFSITAIATIVGLKMFPGALVGPLGGRLLAGLVSAIWVLARIFREFGFHTQSPWQHTSLSFNAYTFVYQLQQWAINYLDRFLIMFFMPLSTVGVYDFALKCVVPIELMLNGLNASINPSVISLITEQKTKGATVQINRYFYGLVSAILLLVCLTIAAVPLLLDTLIIKSDYARAIPYIPYLALIYIFKSARLYFVLPYSVLKKMQRLTILNFIVTVIKIGLMILLIWYWQLYGLIISAFIAYTIEIILLWYNLKDDYAMRFNVIKLLGIPVFLFLTIITAESLFDDTYSLVLHTFYGIFSVVLLYMVYRNELKMLDPLKFLR
jgi:O-antigen/teichoic acid export membrane protein